MSNLSELSIQLRKIQSEKNAQANEIDRLQRQVRILSELKGISISDLQDALKWACEAEAHGELRALVGKLQAKLDGSEPGVGGVGGLRRANRANYNDNENNTPTQEQFNQEAAARARTNLELRIGELEEIESTLREELDSLYKSSQKSTERNTFLETQLLQQKAQLELWERRWKAKEEEELERRSVVPMPISANGSYNYSDFATSNSDASTSQPILLHNAPQSHIDAQREQRLIVAETALTGEKQQRSLIQFQLSSTQKSYGLKMEQYQHRIQFLEEQLHDLEQQLSSLYVAFGIIQNDNKEERNEKEAWKRNLIESDAAIAKKETKREMNQKSSKNGSIAGERPIPKRERSSRRVLTKLLSPSSSLPKTAVKPVAKPPIAKGLLLLLLDKDGQPLPPGNAPLTPRSKSFPTRKLPLKLHKSPSHRSASALKLKKQYCVLHGANGLYQIRYGDSYTGPVSGVHEFLTAGVSSIDHTARSSGQPFGFEIMINANVTDAPILCCAAETEDDFMMWMAALMSVVDGSIDSQHGSGNAAPAFKLGF